MNTASVRTPAKLNLGLEVIGRRADGYHELVTVYQAIDIYDELVVEAGKHFHFVGSDRIPVDRDLARPVLVEAARHQRWSGTTRLRKRIPVSAGLGGGSSDAALAVRLALHGETPDAMRRRALTIGADVPFFIAGGTALATGVGERLEALATPALWFVVVSPALRIRGKTTALFGGLVAADFSDGRAVRSITAALGDGKLETLDALPNTFERQMLAHPAVREAWNHLRRASGRAALSGAGPSVYSWHTSRDKARDVASRVRRDSDGAVAVARAIGRHGDEPEIGAVLAILKSRR